VGTVEQEIGWIPFFLDQIDFQFTQRARRGATFGISGDGVLPSDFWHTNCFASFQEDANGLRLRDVIGVDTLVWGSDYPHIESTFPRSREILSSTMKGVPAEEVRRIVRTNVAGLYDIPAPPAA
jgi:predicted TIM-barrel fold metal-dependent hydrolase